MQFKSTKLVQKNILEKHCLKNVHVVSSRSRPISTFSRIRFFGCVETGEEGDFFLKRSFNKYVVPLNKC